MTSFADLVANLNLNIQNFSTNLRKASNMADAFAANLKGQVNAGLIQPAKKANFEFKDVARIVQGIIISKVFYSGLNAIRNCTNAVWEFSQELEYAKIAYSNLFGDTALAQEFINVLEDFAATTPFSFSESEAAAKRLLAYGIQYKNVMYVMQGVLAASSVQNNPQVIQSVSRAIGQIYTKGRLMNEEMRQLAEAGIPAYEILADKLGLTQEQMSNLGRQAIPASVAINALVEGMNERFGGVVQASATTMKGIISNIKDNATMIASGVFQPVYDGIKSVLYQFGQFLFKLREIYATTGIGGLFEALFPKELHGALRQFAANFVNIHVASLRLIHALGGLLRPILEALLRVYNAFAPILVTVLDLLTVVVRAVTSNAVAMKVLTTAIAAAAAMWVVFKIRALSAAVVAGAINLISNSLKVLSVMLNFVVAHPFWSLLIGLTGLVVGLSGGFGKLSDSINGVFKKLTSFGGLDPDKILLPSQEERADDLGKFNEALDGTSDAMDELADSTGKATKAAKGLLSFDEVFKLNKPDEGTDAGIDLDIPEFGALGDLGLGSALDTDLFDFEGFADDYITELIEAFKNKILGAGLGAVIGGLLGGALGGIPGAKLGAAIGALAGWFWDELATALGLSDFSKVAAPIITGLGAVIGAKLGGPGGAVIGASIGALVSWLIEEIVRGFETGDWSGVAVPAGIGIGAAIGGLVGGPAGAMLGTAVGYLVGDIVNMLADGFTKGEWIPTKLGMSIGAVLGAGIGTIIGGPAGGMLGTAIGTLIGWIGGLIVENWSKIGPVFEEISTTVGDWLTGLVDKYNTWATNVTDTVNAWADDTWNTFTTWCSNTATDIGNWVTNMIDSYNTWADNAETIINNWCDNTWSNISSWLSNVASNVSTWLGNVWSNITGWFSTVLSGISNWFSNILSTTTSWLSNIWSSIMSWLSNLWDSIWGTLSDIASRVNNWWSNLWGNKTANVTVNASANLPDARGVQGGHAVGGIFNREHIARFAEGNKAEAIIPLENQSAMQPFVDAVANGLTSTLMPLVANISGTQTQMQPLYVGTLIADERGLKELERKMQIIRMQETKRRG